MSSGMLNAWIADLIQNGNRSIVRKVAQCNGSNELKRLEQERIKELLTNGMKLFNRQSKQKTRQHGITTPEVNTHGVQRGATA